MFGKDLSLKSQLAIGFASILAFMLIISSVGYFRINYVNDTLSEISDLNAVKQRYAVDFRGSVHDRAIAIRDIVLFNRQSDIDNTLNLIKKLANDYKIASSNMKKIFANPSLVDDKEKDILARINQIEAITLNSVDKIIKLKYEGNQTGANNILLNKARGEFIQWLNVINEFIDYEEVKNQNLTILARDSIKSFLSTSVVLSVVAFFLAIFLAFYITKLIISSLGGEPKDAVRAVMSISNGNLNTTIDTKYKGSMLESLSKMQERLKEIVQEVVSSSKQLNSNAKTMIELSANAQYLVKTQQEKSHESLDSINQGVNTMSEVLNIANQTKENSEQSLAYANDGIKAMRTTINEIDQITQAVHYSSEQIKTLEKHSADIGGSAELIKEITEQTNLLALNAAIEAARAGEAGRGFAVVADEIRKLAEKTDSATNEISNMISLIQQEIQTTVDTIQAVVPQVENGMKLANEANDILSKINSQANDSLSKAQEVASAANEQSAKMQEISANIDDMANSANKANDSMQQNANSANSLNDISQTLIKHISYFKI